MSEPIQDKHLETTDTAVGSTDLLAPQRCEKWGYLGHSLNDCEYPFPQGHRAQQRRDQDWSLLGGQVVGAETWANGAGEQPPPKTTK